MFMITSKKMLLSTCCTHALRYSGYLALGSSNPFCLTKTEQGFRGLMIHMPIVDLTTSHFSILNKTYYT